MTMATSPAVVSCDHCLLPVGDREAIHDERPEGRKTFCCHACRSIYRMIQDEGLAEFYARRDWTTAGIPVPLRGEAPPVAGALSPEPESLLPFIRGDHAEKEASLLIDGIRCASCVWLLEKVLERTRGVISARIGFATHRATVRWNGEKATLSGIIARLRSIGYLARPFSAAEQEESLRLQNRDLLLRFGTAAFFSMQLMILSFGLYAGYFQGIDPATRRWVEYFSLLACTPVLAYSGRPFFRGAIRGIRNGMLNMDVLVSLGAASAYTLSVYQMLGGGPVYFDTAAMIITLVLLGRYLESLAKHRASQAVHRLLALQPREARVVHGQDRAMVTTSEVGKGDLIEIRPGETIPLDGIVRSGATEVDESLVTGESRPAERTVGAAVIGGSMNGLGTIMVEVIHVGQETVLARIADLVERAQTAAMPVQRLADRISAYFVPFVLLLSVATFWYWHRFFYAGPSLLAAVSVLVIACPCALGMATPVAVLAGMDAAARKGILFKGGDVLERMHKVNSVVLDKTGTLTAGKVRVSKVWSGAPEPDADRVLLRIAASAEQGSEHLLGEAIVAHAREQGEVLLDADAFKALPGQGASALVDGQRILVGRRPLLEREGIIIPAEMLAQAERLERDGRTVVYVSRSKDALGIIGLMDAPKPDAAAAVRRLKRAGVTVAMITGDNQETAQIIGERTGIDLVRSGVLPEGKAEEVLKLRRSGRVVAMAGDGINDAPALAAADVGIAMASGTDIAMESADVVIMRSELTGVADALDLSRRTFRVISQNLFWAFFYNLAAIPLAMAGFLNPIIAAAAMAVSSITVVLNSLRLR